MSPFQRKGARPGQMGVQICIPASRSSCKSESYLAFELGQPCPLVGHLTPAASPTKSDSPRTSTPAFATARISTRAHAHAQLQPFLAGVLEGIRLAHIRAQLPFVRVSATRQPSPPAY